MELQGASFMEDLIEERQNDITKIGQIMENVNQLTNDLATEVQIQDEKIGILHYIFIYREHWG